MPISHKHKLIMIHVPKNGGTSIQKSLEMEQKGHFPPDLYRNKYPSEWLEYTSFAVIRNPIERFVSSYNYACMESSMYHNAGESTGPEDRREKHGDYDYCTAHDINDIVEPIVTRTKEMVHHGWRSQFNWIVDRSGSIDVDYLVLLDKLGEAMKELAPNADIDVFNKSKKVGDSLTDENKELLSQYYATDMKLYDMLEGNALTKLR